MIIISHPGNANFKTLFFFKKEFYFTDRGNELNEKKTKKRI